MVYRLLGLQALILFVLVSLPFARPITDRSPLLPLWVGLGGAALLTLTWAIFLAPSLPIVARVQSALPGKIGLLTERVFSAFRPYRGKRKVLAKAFGLSVLLQANVVL